MDASLQSREYYTNQQKMLPVNFNSQAYTSFNGNHGAYAPLPNIPFNGSQPKAMFDNHQFRNRGDLMDNNLENILLNEEITEYHVQIDSKDRNPLVYPNPFKYKVIFSPLDNLARHSDRTPGPVIQQSFTNVRYIVLENAILPIFDDVDMDHTLTENLYVLLNIKEYENRTNRYSTNDALMNSFAVMYNDKVINKTHYTTWSSNGIRIFPKDQLAKIDKLTISLQNEYGEDLRVGGMNSSCKDLGRTCRCIPYDEGDPDDPTTIIEEEIDIDCVKHNICHPMNRRFQNHFHFRVGVVEAHMNKKVFS